MTDVHRIVTGPWKENCYVVAAGADAIVVDPGGELEAIQAHVEQAKLTVRAVLNTHAHYDHLGAVAGVVAAYDAPFHLHPDDADLLVRANFYRTLFLGEAPITIPTLDVPLADGDALRFGALAVEVAHTPGHTPGSVAFAIGDLLFTGDTIMASHLGRTDLPGGDRTTLLDSVARLAAAFAPETTIHPGHGRAAALGAVLPLVDALPELR